MNDSDMDRILGNEEELVPSSGFVSSVMDRIREEAAAPAPIPSTPIAFPWRRIVPGVVLGCGGLGWGAVELARLAMTAAPEQQPMALPMISPPASQPLQSLGWAALSLAVALGSWMLARRIGGQSRLL